MKVQTKCEQLGKYACLAFCYIYCAGIPPKDQAHYIALAIKAMDLGLLDNECTVSNAEKFIAFISGKECTVIKEDIKSINDIIEPTPVRFDNGRFSHWVVVSNGEVVFDPLDNSQCVKFGLPKTARKIIWKK